MPNFCKIGRFCNTWTSQVPSVPLAYCETFQVPTCLSEEWWPGVVCSQGIHMNIGTEHHKCLHNSASLHLPTCVGVVIAKGTPVHCPPSRAEQEITTMTRQGKDKINNSFLGVIRKVIYPHVLTTKDHLALSSCGYNWQFGWQAVKKTLSPFSYKQLWGLHLNILQDHLQISSS